MVFWPLTVASRHALAGLKYAEPLLFLHVGTTAYLSTLLAWLPLDIFSRFIHLDGATLCNRRAFLDEDAKVVENYTNR